MKKETIGPIMGTFSLCIARLKINSNELSAALSANILESGKCPHHALFWRAHDSPTFQEVASY